MDTKKLLQVISTRFPHYQTKIITLKAGEHFDASDWIKILENTKLCFYLTELPFDWPFLALESIYFKVPLLYFDSHPVLSEWLPNSPLRLSQFLINQPSISDLTQAVQEQSLELADSQLFAPLGLAKQYHTVYQTLI